MKRLVLASYAQYGVGAEFEEYMDDRNGIRQPFHLFAETYFREIFFILRLRREPIMWLKLWIE